MTYFHTRRTGDISRRLTGFRQAREFLVHQGSKPSPRHTALRGVTLMFVYSWRLALVFCAVAPAYAALMRYSLHRLRPMYDNLEESFGKYTPADRRHQGHRDGQVDGAEGILRTRMLDQFTAIAQRIFVPISRSTCSAAPYDGDIPVARAVLWWARIRFSTDASPSASSSRSNALVLLADGALQVLLSMWTSTIRVGAAEQAERHLRAGAGNRARTTVLSGR